MMRSVPHIREGYLPPGISQITIYPARATVTQVLTVDLDETVAESLRQYVPDLKDYDLDTLDVLEDYAQRIHFQGTGDLEDSIRRAEVRLRALDAEREQILMHGRSAFDIDYPTAGGIGLGFLVGLEAFLLLPMPWSLIVACTSLPIGLAARAGLHRARAFGRNSSHHDQYRETIISNTPHFVPLDDPEPEQRPPEHVSFRDVEHEIETIHSSISFLYTAGLSNAEAKTRTIGYLDKLIRNKLAAERAWNDYHPTASILAGLTATDISEDAELNAVKNAADHHREQRRLSLEAVVQAFNDLQTLAAELASSARVTEAKLRATRYVIEHPTHRETGGDNPHQRGSDES